MAKKLKIWNGASWEDVTFAITPPTTNVTNSFTTNQVIDTSTSVAALRITQRGTGEALRVEDDTNPDSSPFIINADGLVGIGTTDFSVRSSTNGGAKIVTNGGMAIINYGDDSSITVARANGTSSSPTQVLANQRIAFFIGSSYFTGATSGFINNTAMNFHAAENITDVARGSFITFDTTNIGAAFRSERMRIDASGNVGIGTSSPANKLHVLTSADYSTATFESSGAEVNISLKSTSANGRDYRIVSGGSTGGFAGGLFGIYDATAGAIRFYITSNGSAVFNGGEFISQVGGVNKLQVTNGAVKIWAGRGGVEGGELYLASTGSANGYNNNNDAVFDVYDGSVRLSPDGFNKIYYLRPVGDNGTTIGIRNTTASTSNPSGGQDGDMWAVYV